MRHPKTFAQVLCRIRTVYERIDTHIERRDGHWIWTGYIQNGHPIINMLGGSRSRRSVARLLYEKALGQPLAKRRLANQCGVRLCVNPTHYGRVLDIEWQIYNEYLPRLEAIRAARETLRSIGEKYGITAEAVRLIVSRRSYALKQGVKP